MSLTVVSGSFYLHTAKHFSGSSDTTQTIALLPIMKATIIEQSSMKWKLNNRNLQSFFIFKIVQKCCHVELLKNSLKIVFREYHYLNSGTVILLVV